MTAKYNSGGKLQSGADSQTSSTLPLPRRGEVAGNSVEQAATYLRRLIFSRVLPAGARIPQDEVARTLGMTRVPVREALLILELEGRVRIVPNRGAYVVTVTEQSAHDAIDLLSLLYSFAARRAIERSTPKLLDDLAKANDRVQATNDLIELHYAFDAFQDVIVRGGLDARLAGFISRLRQLSPDTIYEHDPTIALIVKDTADKTLSAVVKGDLAEIEAVMRASHETILSRLTPLLRNDGLMTD